MSSTPRYRQTNYARPREVRDFDKQHWGEEHEVIPEVMPFEWGRFNQVDALCAITTLIETVPETSKTISASQIGSQLGIDTVGIRSKLVPLAELHGAWRINSEHDTKEMQFLNPNYIHTDELCSDFTVSDSSTRLEILERLAGYGVAELKLAGPWFGIKPNSVKRFARRHEFNWQQKRSDGLQQMVRTWATLLDWGYSLTQLGNAFGYEPTSIRSMIIQKIESDFTPPQDPTKGVTRPSTDSSR